MNGLFPVLKTQRLTNCTKINEAKEYLLSAIFRDTPKV